MATETPNFGFHVIPASDTTTKVKDWRSKIAGDDASSDMMQIDRVLKEIQDGQVTLPDNVVVWQEGTAVDPLPVPSPGGGRIQVASQPDEPTNPDILLWIDTDDQQNGVDISLKADLVNGKVPAEQLPEITPASIGAAATDHTHTAAQVGAAAAAHTHTAAQVGAAATNHTHTAANITGLAGTDYATFRVRGIAAGTTDLTAGASDLESGTIYLVYE